MFHVKHAGRVERGSPRWMQVRYQALLRGLSRSVIALVSCAAIHHGESDKPRCFT